jgi:hypothetical protein
VRNELLGLVSITDPCQHQSHEMLLKIVVTWPA